MRGGFDEEVIMVVHQAIIMDIDFVGMACLAEYLQKHFFVFIAFVDVAFGYTTVDDMMKPIEV